MKTTSLEKRHQAREELSGMNFKVSAELNKDAKKAMFPKKLEKANKIVARLNLSNLD